MRFRPLFTACITVRLPLPHRLLLFRNVTEPTTVNDASPPFALGRKDNTTVGQVDLSGWCLEMRRWHTRSGDSRVSDPAKAMRLWVCRYGWYPKSIDDFLMISEIQDPMSTIECFRQRSPIISRQTFGWKIFAGSFKKYWCCHCHISKECQPVGLHAILGDA